MPFSTGPYAQYSVAVTAPTGPTTLHSSRHIDFAAQAYVMGDDGEYEGMDDIVQRVILAVAFAARSESTIIDERTLRTREADIRSALSTMTSPPEPDIVLEKVSSVRGRPGRIETRVRFKNLRTGSKTSVVIP